MELAGTSMADCDSSSTLCEIPRFGTASVNIRDTTTETTLFHCIRPPPRIDSNTPLTVISERRGQEPGRGELVSSRACLTGNSFKPGTAMPVKSQFYEDLTVTTQSGVFAAR